MNKVTIVKVDIPISREIRLQQSSEARRYTLLECLWWRSWDVVPLMELKSRLQSIGIDIST